MSIVAMLIIIIALGIIVGGIMVLKKSAKKFNLNKEQLKRIQKRSKEQDDKDKKNN
jgi:type II secretory pathway pseudopilin PulG